MTGREEDFGFRISDLPARGSDQRIGAFCPRLGGLTERARLRGKGSSVKSEKIRVKTEKQRRRLLAAHPVPSLPFTLYPFTFLGEHAEFLRCLLVTWKTSVLI